MKNSETFNCSLQRVATTNDLCVLLGTTTVELNKILYNLPRHYRKKVHSTAAKTRTFYIASPHLKSLQHKIEQFLLEFPIHEAAHGGRKGCSPLTAAKAHIGKSVVVEVDLRDCYPSISHHKVYGLLVDLGCTPEVARALTKLTTIERHLAQGLDTSPVIANLMLRKADIRISGICKTLNYSYARYVDDIIMSGSGSTDYLMRMVGKILRQSGFSVNEDKFERSGIQPRTGRQEVLGLVVNRKRNLPREKRRVCRAIIHNCWVDGPTNELGADEKIETLKTRTQGHLSYYHSVNPKAARQLNRKFKRINWTP